MFHMSKKACEVIAELSIAFHIFKLCGKNTLGEKISLIILGWATVSTMP